MPTVAFYLLKVILCTAILFAYYQFFLRNKVYHAYNRFYLLATVVIALVAPLINFTMLLNGGKVTATPIQLLQAVNSSDEYLEEIIIYSHRNYISSSQVLIFLYLLVSIFLLVALIKMLSVIFKILKTNSSHKIKEITFVESEANGTPFSFFNFIFWNKAIDVHSQTGRQIFAHELAHVREKHSVDKLFLNIVLIFCWINPIFWLIKKELNLIHEFIADKKAVANNDAAALAAMIVTSAYPKHSYLLTNHFFYSPIKRRLQMLSKYQTTRAGYVYRILALPVILFLIAAFTIKTKTGIEKLINPAKKITVVIDAGHGGKDGGAIGLDGSIEKDINLAFIKKIKELNNAFNIDLVFTRETDIYQTPQEKAIIAQKAGADLFISVHTSSEPFSSATKSGMEVFVSKDEYSNSQASKLFASSVIAHFKTNYSISVAAQPIQRKVGIQILQINECPSIIIETGYISNSKDLAYLQTSKAKEDFAKNILEAISQYADNINNKPFETSLSILETTKDTLPNTSDNLGYYKGEEIKNITVSKDCEVVQLKLANGKTISMSMNEAKKQHIILPPPPPPVPPLPPLPPLSPNSTLPALPPIPPVPPVAPPPPPPAKRSNASIQNNIDASEHVVVSTNNSFTIKSNINQEIPIPLQPLLVLNGMILPYSSINNINPENIAEVNVLKGENAIAKYGATKSVNGVIEIKTKITTNINTNYNISTKGNLQNSSQNENKQTDSAKIFVKLEEEAEFPGGKDAWQKYMREKLNVNMPVDEGWTDGSYTFIIRFIVAKDGSLRDVVAENYKDSKTAKMCVDFIKNGPKWIPGKQNNKIVNSYKKQPITFVIQEQ